MQGSPKEQLEMLRERVVDLISPEELLSKLERSAQTGQPLRIKYGADPSAPDIHLGHVVGLNKLREFQNLGHTVVFLIGDFTGMIGDPSGRSQTRPPLSREEVLRNAETYQKQVYKVLDPTRTEIRFNSEWCASLRFEDVVRLAARVTVAQLLARDDFSKRYQEAQPISLVEFLYPLIQAYDSVMLKADVEVGGTDQLFNLLLGRELQKSYGEEPQVVMTLPLLEGLDGVNKMSKSLGNYVGVTDPPREMFGKLMSISDDLMWRYFSLVLCLPDAEISSLRQSVQRGLRHPREVKDELAQRIVARFHSHEQAASASEEFRRVFSQKELPDEITEIRIGPEDLQEGRVEVVGLLIKAKLASSRSEARRLIEQGAVRIDNQRITDIKARVVATDGMVIRSGKRGFARIRC